MANIAGALQDMANLGAVERYQYGTTNAVTYFIRETRKSTLFSQLPIQLSSKNGNPDFDREWSVEPSKAFDYLIHMWIRVTVPEVKLLAGNVYKEHGRIRWTRNFMHNLIKKVSFNVNDLEIEKFDNYFLDFWNQFTLSSSKKDGYNNMIGNDDDLLIPKSKDGKIESKSLTLPIPFFFSRDSGLALPVGGVKWNKLRIDFEFRNWTELLILENVGAAHNGEKNPCKVPQVGSDIAVAPSLSNVQCWVNGGLIPEAERARMGCVHRDMLIESIQTSSKLNFNPVLNPNPSYDIRFQRTVKALFFGVRNTTNPNVWSNYTTASPVPDADKIDFDPDQSAFDPIGTANIRYESSDRIPVMTADYFSLIEPYYKAPAIPELTGYHMFSYALKMNNVDPSGSANYSILNNVSIQLQCSEAAIKAAKGEGEAKTGTDYAQSFQFLVIAISQNVLTLKNGMLGLPFM